MPLYEYECDNHGVFDEFRAYAYANTPAKCPACGQGSIRVMSVPRFKVMDSATRIGMDRNEKSKHEPRIHKCGPGCNHGPAKQKNEIPPALKNYTGARPWVVEHA